MECIEAQQIDIAYDGTLIVKELDMQVPRGQITSIIGPNGCGKSTLLKAVGRLLKTKSGMICLTGTNIRTLPTKEVARQMAILPQTPAAPSGLTVGQLVAYGRFPHQRGFGKLSREDKSIVAWALSVTQLTAFEHREVDTLSGGQRQRVWISMALAQQTDLILLDEPTAGTDYAGARLLSALCRKAVSEGTAILMITHEPEFFAGEQTKIWTLDNGKLREN